MSKCLLLIGPICSGKTKLAEKLIEKEFLTRGSNFYSIENCRRGFGNGLMSGEMFAWANFLQQIEEPPTNDNAIYEFSGTGKNNYNVAEAIKYSCQQNELDWRIVYCLAPSNILLERFQGKVYDAPCPYKFDDPMQSINFMNQDLKGSYEADWQWNRRKKLKFNMSVEDYGAIADEIINDFQ